MMRTDVRAGINSSNKIAAGVVRIAAAVEAVRGEAEEAGVRRVRNQIRAVRVRR